MTDYLSQDAGWMSVPELDFLCESVRAVKSDHPILEVGVWKGLSTSALTLEGTVFCVDHFHVSQWKTGAPPGYRGEFILPSFIENMESVDRLNNVVIIPMDSFRALRLLHDCGVRFRAALVDADHSEEGCLADLIAVYGLLEPGGVLLADDYHGSWDGVRRAVDRFVAGHGLSIDSVCGKVARIIKP